MKKVLSHILISVICFLLVGGIFTPKVAEASCSPFSSVYGAFRIVDCAAEAGNIVLTLTSKLVYISGVTLNSAMNLTLNMGKITGSATSGSGVTALEETWRILRDFASICFIFLLLYGSICMILGVEGLAPRDLIPKIVLCGLLINFSLFFCRVAIDASNLLSLGFYNAIAPITADYSVTAAPEAADGGISNAFMSALKITSVYDPKAFSAGASDTLAPGFKVITATILGSFIMLIAAGSFFAVTFMLVIRIALLVMLMAFSPLYFVGMVLPNTKKFSDEWLSLFTGQLTFLPTYLALIYIALRIMTHPSFSQAIMKVDNVSYAQAFITGDTSVMGIILNYLIIIVMLNFALTQAISIAGKAGKWGEKYSKMTKAFIGTRTLAFTAHRIKESNIGKEILSRVPLGRAMSIGLNNIAKSDFGAKEAKGGYEAGYKANVKSRTDFAKSLGYDDKAVRQAQMQTAAAQDAAIKLEEQKRDHALDLAARPGIRKVDQERSAQIAANADARIKQLTETRKAKIDAAGKTVKEARQRRVAEGERSIFNNPFSGRIRNDAAKAIEKELGKSENDKALEELQKIFGGDKDKKDDKKDDKDKGDAGGGGGGGGGGGKKK